MTETFGARLAQARREYAARIKRDVTGPEIAEAVGVSGSAYYKWENDMKKPRSKTVARLAQILGVTPGWLDYGQEPKDAPAITSPKRTFRAQDALPEAEKEPIDEKKPQARRKGAMPPKKRKPGAA